jgi:nicotinamide-nucleotide amidase
VSQATISLRVTAEEATPDACLAAMDSTVTTIHQSLRQLVFGEGDETELQHVVAQLLIERGATLSTAEWGTAGVLAQWLNDVPENERFFRGGLLANSHSVLVGALGIPAEVIEQFGTSSAETARAMAEHCRQQMQSDYALAVSAIPTGEAETFFLALATPHETIVRSARTIGHPDILRPRSAKQALDLLRLTLLKSR